ncbi:MAG: family 1 glycosylhydrolase [Sporolactobacillus sp.]
MVCFYYDHIVDTNITSVATLCACDLPLSLLERFGGWTSRKTVSAYQMYVDTIFERFKGISNSMCHLTSQTYIPIDVKTIAVFLRLRSLCVCSTTTSRF